MFNLTILRCTSGAKGYYFLAGFFFEQGSDFINDKDIAAIKVRLNLVNVALPGIIENFQ